MSTDPRGCGSVSESARSTGWNSSAVGEGDGEEEPLE